MSYRGTMDGWHGDEMEIEGEIIFSHEKYEEEHADDWEYEFNEEE